MNFAPTILVIYVRSGHFKIRGTNKIDSNLRIYNNYERERKRKRERKIFQNVEELSRMGIMVFPIIRPMQTGFRLVKWTF